MVFYSTGFLDFPGVEQTADSIEERERESFEWVPLPGPLTLFTERIEQYLWSCLTHIADEVWSQAINERNLQSLEYTRASWTQLKTFCHRKLARGNGAWSFSPVLSSPPCACVGVRWCDGLRLYECIIASCKCEQLKMCFRQKLSFYLCEIKANRQTYLRFVCAWNVNVCQGLRIRYRAASSSPLSAALRHFSILIYFTLFLFSRTFLLCRAGDQEKLLAESRKNIWNFDGNIKLATSLTFHLTVIDAPLFLGGNTLHAPLFPSSLHDLHAIRLL